MLTRRKKLNLIYLSIGFFSGIILSIVIVYFGGIKQFTQSSINKIHYTLPLIEKDTIINKTKKIKIYKKESFPIKDSLNTIENLIETDTLDIDSTFLFEEEQIKQDHKIASVVLPIIYIETDSNEINDSYLEEINVEQWENPTNFAGYKKTKNTLIIYGINLDEIEIQYIDNILYLIFRDKKLPLKESNTFIRFSAAFLAK